MSISIVKMSAVLFLGLLLAPAAVGQEPRPPAAPADAASLQKRITELEDQLSSTRQELRRLRRELEDQMKVRVVLTRSVNVKEAAKVLQFAYGGRPGFRVAALAEMKCLLLRTDDKTTEEALRVVASLEKVAAGQVQTSVELGPGGTAPMPPPGEAPKPRKPPDEQTPPDGR